MLYIVSFKNSADVIGATLPGKANAHIVFIPFCFAASLSTPPGFDAKSIIKQLYVELYLL